MSGGTCSSTQVMLGTKLSHMIRPRAMVRSMRKSGLTNSSRKDIDQGGEDQDGEGACAAYRMKMSMSEEETKLRGRRLSTSVRLS